MKNLENNFTFHIFYAC